MPKYALTIEYHGAPFVGWSRQKHQCSVQSTIEQALQKVENKAHKLVAAGRTDAGVHATGQVAHCEMTTEWNTDTLQGGLNHHLKNVPISILDCRAVPADWNARFSAVRRHYLYRILIRRAPATIEAGLVWQRHHDLDLAQMQTAAQYLVGKHDFTTFRSTTCQATSPVKTLDSIAIKAVLGWSGPEFHFVVRAKSFMHNQVRSIVGTIERVGANAWPPEQVLEALEAKDRSACGPVAPAHGLYLTGVDYPNF